MAMGQHDPLVTEHPIYLALGSNPQARQKNYSEYINRLNAKRDNRNPKFSEKLYIGSENFGIPLMGRGYKLEK